jgi:hypothetical protein
MSLFNLHFDINKCVSDTLLTTDEVGLWLKQRIENLRMYAQVMKMRAEVHNFDKGEDLRRQVKLSRRSSILVWHTWSLCPEYSVRVLRVVCTVLALTA